MEELHRVGVCPGVAGNELANVFGRDVPGIVWTIVGHRAPSLFSRFRFHGLGLLSADILPQSTAAGDLANVVGHQLTLRTISAGRRR